MTNRLADLAVSTALAGSLLLANTSCATRHPEDEAKLAPRPPAHASSARRVAQLSFGTDAAFGVCIEPACPAVTPKTVSMLGVASMQAVAQRTAQIADATRDPGPPTATPIALLPMLPVAAPALDTAVRTVVVTFPFASAELIAPARAALSASMRQARASERIVISGRTDAVGNDQVNESLALARALSVRNYLRDRAPDLAADISIDAKGGCCFVAPNETEDGRSRNRRVEVAFFSRGGI